MAELAVKRGMAEAPLMRFPEATLFPRGFFDMNPFGMMRQMTGEMDRFFGAQKAEPGAKNFWAPAVEVRRKNGNLAVLAELPGMTKEDIKVKVIDQTLILEGERKEEKEEKKDGYYHTERSYGQFYRTIPLPEGAQLDKVAAQFTNGLLEVTVPVPEAKHQAHEVPVQVGGAIKGASG